MNIKVIILTFNLLLIKLISYSQTISVRLSFPPDINHTAIAEFDIPDLGYNTLNFIFPSNIPGTVKDLMTGNLCNQIEAYDSLGKKLNVIRKNSNVFEIQSAKQLRKIKYIINDSWGFKDSTLILPQIGSHFNKGKHILINPAVVIGFLDGFQTLPIDLKIEKPNELNLHTVNKLNTQSNEWDNFNFENYFQLIDNPILYFKGTAIPFTIGNTRFKLAVYSETEIIGNSDVMKILRPVIEGVYQFCHEFSVNEYYFFFNYVNPSTNRQKTDEVYGAIQHSKTSVFYLPETQDKVKLAREIQFTSAHELFHLFKPLNIKTDATSTLNLKAKLNTSHLWLFEGVTEYLSLLMLYRNDLITHTEFLTEIRNKMSLMSFMEPFNLIKESERMHLDGNERKYSNFYNKGAVVAFMLDLELLKQSEGKMGLLELLLRLQRTSKDRYVIQDKMVIPELIRLSYPKLDDFFEKYIESDSSIDYNKFLSVIGLVYEDERTDTNFLYANAQYKYNKETDEVYMTQITLNNVGFKEGDVLVKINNKKITKDNVDEILDQIQDIKYIKPVVFTVRRNGLEIKLTGDPMLINKIQKNVIKPDKEIKPKKVKYSKSFKSGEYRLEKM